jgi:DNA polymerase delta subunit 1
MSPIKRALSEHSNVLFSVSPKRLRGGGDDFEEDFGGGPVDEEVLFDDDDDALIRPVEVIPEEVLEAAAKDIPETVQQRWKRPELGPEWTDNTKNLDIQWIDMDVVSGTPLLKNPNSSKDRICGSQEGEVPILRCYGVNDQGHSVAVFIHGFTPYAYFALPPGSQLTADTDANLGDIRKKINAALQSAARGWSEDKQAVIGLQYVQGYKSIMGYETPYTRFLKVYVALPGLVPTLKRIMEEGIELPHMTTQTNNSIQSTLSFAPFECNVPFVLRFMVDRDISGAGWLTLPAQTYQIRDAFNKETHCQVRCGFSRDAGKSCKSSRTHLSLRTVNHRLKSISCTMKLYPESQKENGTRLPRFAYCRSISNVKDEKDTSQKQNKTPLYRLPTQ